MTVNFENTVIVMTTNAGSSEKVAASVGFAGSSNMNSEAKTRKALEQFLRPEFINRVDEIIVFNSLNEQDFDGIARLMLNDLKKSLAERQIEFAFSDEAASLISKESYSPVYGARNMRRYIQKNVEDELAEKMLADYNRSFTKVDLIVKDEKLYLDCQ